MVGGTVLDDHKLPARRACSGNENPSPRMIRGTRWVSTALLAPTCTGMSWPWEKRTDRGPRGIPRREIRRADPLGVIFNLGAAKRVVALFEDGQAQAATIPGIVQDVESREFRCR